MSEPMYKAAQSSMPPRLHASLNPVMPKDYPSATGTCVPTPPEIFSAVNTINEHLDQLASCIEVLAVKLVPVMRPSYPQEACDKNCPSLPQTELGRILGEHSARLNMSIAIIRDLNERTML